VAATVAKAAVAAAVSASAAYAVVSAWSVASDERRTLLQGGRVGAAILAGVLVFAVTALILRIGEVEDLRKAVLRRFRG